MLLTPDDIIEYINLLAKDTCQEKNLKSNDGYYTFYILIILCLVSCLSLFAFMYLRHIRKVSPLQIVNNNDIQDYLNP